MGTLGGEHAYRHHNHMKIWGIALPVGLVGSWILRMILFQIVFRIGGLGPLEIIFYYPLFLWLFLFLMVGGGLAGIFYLKGTFMVDDRPGGALGQQPMGGMMAAGAAAGTAASAEAGVVDDGSVSAPIRTELQYDGQACVGDLRFGPDRLYYVVYKNQSAIKANAGQAVARQFGLIGVLIAAIVSAIGAKKRKAELDAAIGELDGMSLEEQINHNPASFVLPASEITLVRKSWWAGNYMQAGGRKIVFRALPPELLHAMPDWCAANSVATKGL